MDLFQDHTMFIHPSIAQACNSAAMKSVWVLMVVLFVWKCVRTSLTRSIPNCDVPLYPSKVPLLGHTILMAWNTRAALDQIVQSFCNIPVRLDLLVMKLYIISGSDAITAMLNERNLHENTAKALSVANMFGIPAKTMKFWMSDDSGVSPQPLPESKVPAHLRVSYYTYGSSHRFLVGPSLKTFARRFVENMLQQKTNVEASVGAEWVELPDLWPVVREKLFHAAVRAMCGDYLIKLNPSFVEDFWNLNQHICFLAKGYPRWIYPHPYRVRDKCLEAIKRWHAHIEPYVHNDQMARDDWNENYGASIVWFRTLAWAKMEAMNADARASDDLALIWAANGNSVTVAYWMLAEILHRSELRELVRSRVRKFRTSPTASALDLDFETMCDDPLLQAIYAETMRQRVAIFFLRSPARQPFKFRQWSIPADSIMMASGHHAHIDAEAWDPTGTKPVGEFWPERFLRDHNGETISNIRTLADAEIESLTFSMGGLSAWWLPYGRGLHMCPGRHFAKQEIIVSAAIMTTMFDIDLLDDRLPECDMNSFGFGAMPPKSALRARMRRALLT